MADHFFQESLFRMGTRSPIQVDSDRVVEAYVISETDQPAALNALENYQLELNLHGSEDRPLL